LPSRHVEPPADPASGTAAAAQGTPQRNAVQAPSRHELSALVPLMPAPARRRAPAAPAALRAAGGTAARLAAAAPARDAAEATEVHIHIGRIDVTALREAAPARRRPAPAPAATSLDAYLAKRSRG